jgi:hypothetical protein
MGCPTGLNGVPDEWPDGVPDGWPDGVLNRAKRGPDGARRSARQGGGRKDYLLLKEKITCSVYVSCKSLLASDVSCKSLLASDVSNAGWM